MYAIPAHPKIALAFMITQISCVYVPVVQTMPTCLVNRSHGGYTAEDHGPLGIVVDAF